jgi:hypothetical protein
MIWFGSGSAPHPLAYFVTIAKKFKIYISHNISLKNVVRAGARVGAASFFHAGAASK